MNTEQERKDFEAWARKHLCMPDSVPLNWDAEWTLAALEGYQAGRAALQEQDREGATAKVDAAMESVRKQFCALPRYSFVMRKSGVSRVHDRTGNWIEFDQAHKLFDPINVDHTRRIDKENQ